MNGKLHMGLQVSFALLVGIGTSFFHTHLLIEALGLTAVTVACIFIIASSTSVDFTMAGAGQSTSLACIMHNILFQIWPEWQVETSGLCSGC